MYDPVIVLRGLTGNPALQGFQGLANRKGVIEAQSKASGEGWAELPAARLGPGPHHLKLAAIDSTFREEVGIESLKIVSAADYGALYFPPLGSSLDYWQIDRA